MIERLLLRDRAGPSRGLPRNVTATGDDGASIACDAQALVSGSPQEGARGAAASAAAAASTGRRKKMMAEDEGPPIRHSTPRHVKAVMSLNYRCCWLCSKSEAFRDGCACIWFLLAVLKVLSFKDECACRRPVDLPFISFFFFLLYTCHNKCHKCLFQPFGQWLDLIFHRVLSSSCPTFFLSFYFSRLFLFFRNRPPTAHLSGAWLVTRYLADQVA